MKSMALEIATLACVPVCMGVCVYVGWEQTALFTTLVALLSLLPFFLRLERRKPRARDLMPLVVLIVTAVVGRMLFAPFPNVKPLLAIVIVAGLCFGRQSGFLVGALSVLASNFFFGQGVWTPWQMYACGLAGYLAGGLGKTKLGQRNAAVLCLGALAAYGYGWMLNSWFILGFVEPLTLHTALAAYGAGFAFDTAHAAATVVFLGLIWVPWRKKFARIQQKYGIQTE